METGLCRSYCSSGWFQGQHGPELVAGLARGLSILQAHLVDGICQTVKTRETPSPERPRRACWALVSGQETWVLAPVGAES